MKCRVKEEPDFVLTCWQFDPKAPRPVWVFRVAHNIDGGETLSMISHASPGGVIEVNPTDWFLRDESGVVMVMTAEVFAKSMEIVPDESKPKDQSPVG